MLERNLETRLKLLVKAAGGVAYKLDSRTHKGAPDRVVVLPGRPPIFVELKTLAGHISPLQQVELCRIHAAGGQAVVLRGLAEIEAFVQGDAP